VSGPLSPFDLRPLAAEPGEASRPYGATRLPPAPPPLGEDDVGVRADSARPVRVARGINAVLVALCLLGSIQVTGLVAIEIQRVFYAEAEIARLEAELEAIRRETADLRAVAEHGEDERYRELLARRQGYVYPWETRFIGPSPR
jgi:cell division protein FtsB